MCLTIIVRLEDCKYTIIEGQKERKRGSEREREEVLEKETLSMFLNGCISFCEHHKKRFHYIIMTLA